MLAEYTLTPEEAAAQQHKSVIVAVRDSHLMATAFHPELTQVRSSARAHKQAAISTPLRCPDCRVAGVRCWASAAWKQRSGVEPSVHLQTVSYCSRPTCCAGHTLARAVC